MKNILNFILAVMFNMQKEKISRKYNISSIESRHTLSNKIKILTFRIIPIIITVVLTIIGTSGFETSTIKYKAIIFLAIILIAFSIINCWLDLINNEAIDDLYTFKKKELFYCKTVEEFRNISINVFKDTAFVGQLLWIIGTLSSFLKKSETSRRKELYETIKKLVFQLKDTLDHTNDSGEMVSIAIYLYDGDQSLLDYCSKKSFLMKKKRRGRTWGINTESHLAHTYRSGEGRIIYDILDFYPGEKPQDDDELLYRASVTHPLTFFDEKNTVRGVFCVTSNQKGAFCLQDDYTSEKEDIRRLLSIKSNSIIIIGMIINLLLAITYPEGNEILIEQITELEEKEQINN